MDKPRTLTDSHLTEEILDAVLRQGADLTVYLEPDVTGPRSTGKDPYRENYALPHIVAEGSLAFCMTRGDHFISLEHAGKQLRSYYAYSNIQHLWVHYFPHIEDKALTVLAGLMSLANYQKLTWIARLRNRVLYDSADPTLQDPSQIAEAIEAGSAFTVTVLDERGIWRKLPVDLAFHYPETGAFRFQTVQHWYPDLFDQPALIDRELRENAFPTPPQPAARAVQLRQNFGAVSTYRSLWLDGCMQDIRQMESGKEDRWQRLILFCD